VAVAFDADATGLSGTGTLSWTHTPSGTPAGAVVLVVQNATGADQVSGVTYGGTAMTRVPTDGFVENTTEAGVVYTYFLGSSVPSGAQTVEVTVTDSAVKRGASGTVTASGDTEVGASGQFTSAATNDITVSLDPGAGVESCVFGALHSGEASTGSIATDAGCSDILTADFGAAVLVISRRDAVATGATEIGWTQSADDVAAAGVAIVESGGAPPAAVRMLGSTGVGT
jgi:hypothetical protein